MFFGNGQHGLGFSAFTAVAAAASGATFGPELLTNGGFDDGTGWTLSGATISTGKLRGSGGADTAEQTVSASADGDIYRVAITIDSITTGAVSFQLGGTSTESLSTVGTHVIYFHTGSVGTVFQIDLTSTDAVCDNVSLKKMTDIGGAAELVVDGGFDSPGDWTSSAASVVVQNSRVEATSAAGIRAAYRAPAEPIALNEYFRVAYTVSDRTLGAGGVVVGGTNSGGNASTSSSNGTFTRVIKLTTLTSQHVGARFSNGAQANVDTVSVKKIVE